LECGQESVAIRLAARPMLVPFKLVMTYRFVATNRRLFVKGRCEKLEDN
jgi:hypothetical protein